MFIHTCRCFHCDVSSPTALSENQCDYKAYQAGWVTGRKGKKIHTACPDCKYLLIDTVPITVNGLAVLKQPVEVTKKSDKNNGLHFIIRNSEESNYELTVIGHENSLCIQALKVFSDVVEGKSIANFHFYALHEDSWLHITFKDNDEKNIKKSWLECKYGEVLGTPHIETMNNDANLMELLSI